MRQQSIRSTIAAPKQQKSKLRLVRANQTVSDLEAEHLAWCRKRVAAGKMAAGTLRTIEQRYSSAIRPSIGKIPLRLLAVGAELYGREASKPHGLELVELWHEEATTLRGPTQANRAAETLRAAWLLAERREWVPVGSSPFRFFKLFRSREAWQDATVRVLTPTEMCALLAELRRVETESPHRSQRYAAQAIQLLALTGARRDEILRLTWPEVDLSCAVLRLSGSKTGAKLIPLGHEAVAVLERVERDHASEECFPHANWRSVFWPARKAIGAPDITLHDLRHTWATRALEAGEPVEMVAAALGQRTVAVTRRHYWQPDPEKLVKTANRGARIIAGHPPEENDDMADDRKPATAIHLELPPELLAEIAAETGEEGLLKRGAVLAALRRDLTAYVRENWIGKVRERVIR